MISPNGDTISISEIGVNRFFFNLNNIKVSFFYKNTKILGKILIEDGVNLITLYVYKQNDKLLFVTNNKSVVVSASNDTNIKNKEDKKNKDKKYNIIVNDNSYIKYKQVFVITYIIYLHIHSLME